MAQRASIAQQAARKTNREKKQERRKAAVPEEEKKLEGAGFWAFVALAMFKDGFDVIIAAVGMTSFGTLLIPLTFPLVLMSVGISAAILMYVRMSGVPLGVRKLVAGVIAVLIEITPLAALPMTTIWLFLIRFIEHSDAAKVAARRISRRR